MASGEGYIASISEDGLSACLKVNGQELIFPSAPLTRQGLKVGDRICVSETAPGQMNIRPLVRAGAGQDEQARRASAGLCASCGRQQHYDPQRRRLHPREALDAHGQVLRRGDRVRLPWSGEVTRLDDVVDRDLIRVGGQPALPCEVERLVRAVDHASASSLLYGPRQS